MTMKLPERVAGWAAGKLMVFCAKQAYNRGDNHEYNHIKYAVAYGNSEDCSYPDYCSLDC